MKLADGSDFELGMKVYTTSDTAIETSPQSHEVNTYEFEGHKVYELVRIGSAGGTDLLHYYGTRKAAMEAVIESYRDEIRQIEDCIRRVQESIDAA